MLGHRHSLAFPVAIGVITFYSGCGMFGLNCVEVSGDPIKRPLDLGPFTSIRAEGAVEMVLVQSERNDVIAMGSPELLDLLEATVVNDQLRLRTTGCWKGEHTLTVHIPAPTITGIALHGSGSLKGDGMRKERELDIEVLGSGSVTLNLHVEKLDLKLKGSGRIELDGIATEMDAAVLGSGDLIVRGLEAMKADVVVKGSGDAEVNVVRELDAKVTGSGSIRYRGTPDIRSTINGSGAVTPIP